MGAAEARKIALNIFINTHYKCAYQGPGKTGTLMY